MQISSRNFHCKSDILSGFQAIIIILFKISGQNRISLSFQNHANGEHYGLSVIQFYLANLPVFNETKSAKFRKAKPKP